MKLSLQALSTFAWIIALIPSNCFASDSATLVRNITSSGLIQNLIFSTQILSEGDHYVVKGKYSRLNFQLLLNRIQKIEVLSPDGRFSINIPKNSSGASQFEIIAVAPGGQFEQEVFKIKYSVANAQTKPPEDKRIGLNVGLAMTGIHYVETNIPSFFMYVPTVSLGYSHKIFNDRWDIAATSYLTTFSFVKTANVPNIYFLGVNGRIGYTFPLDHDHWRVTVAGGLYFLSTYGSNTLGYANVLGPQIYPTIIYRFNNRSALAFNCKFSPVTQSLSLLKLSNSEKAAGLAYTFQRTRGGFFEKHSLSVFTEASWLNLATSYGTVGTQTLSLGVTLGF